MKTFTLIIFTLISGQTREIITDDPEMCWLMSVVHSENSLWVEDVDLPRQKPASFHCACAYVDELDYAAVYP